MSVKNILNGAALLLGLAGIIFKTQRWAGADLLLLVGLLLLLVSVLAFTVGANAEAGVPTPLNYVMVGTLAVSVLGFAFRNMHWRGAFALAVAAGVLMLLLSLLLLLSKTAVVSRQFATVLVIYLALVMAVLNLMRARQASAPETAAAEVTTEATD